MPSKLLRLTFILFTPFLETVRVWSGLFSNFEFGIDANGEQLSLIDLTGRLLTNAVIMKNFGPMMFVVFVERNFWIIEWKVSGDQSSSLAQLVSSGNDSHSLDCQQFAKRPGFLHFEQFFRFAGYSFFLVQFGAPRMLQFNSLSFAE